MNRPTFDICMDAYVLVLTFLVGKRPLRATLAILAHGIEPPLHEMVGAKAPLPSLQRSKRKRQRMRMHCRELKKKISYATKGTSRENRTKRAINPHETTLWRRQSFGTGQGHRKGGVDQQGTVHLQKSADGVAD